MNRNPSAARIALTALLSLITCVVPFAFAQQEQAPLENTPRLIQRQPTAPDSKRCTVAGVVSRPGTPEPARRSMVTLVPENDGSGQGNDDEHAGTTDRYGRFEFNNVAPGTYRVVVERNGPARIRTAGTRVWSPYVTVTLAAGEERRDLMLELQPGVTISGTVRDENGEPMRSVLVRALQPLNNEGKHVFWPVGNATTDDHGEYRISGLMAGGFLLQAIPSPPPAGSRTGYPHVFYPDAASREDATTIRLRAGDETVADFTLLPVPLTRLRGHVTGLPSEARVIAGMRNGELSRQAPVGKDGTFEINGLLPGEYTLTAFENGADRVPRLGTRVVRVEGAEMDGIDIAASALISSSAKLTGVVKAVTSEINHGPFSSLNVNLVPQGASGDNEPGSGMRVSGSVDETGKVTIDDVPPGRYTLHMTTSSAGWEDFYTSTLKVAGHDVTDSAFVVPSGGGTLSLDISIAGDGAYLEGVVTDENDKPVPNAVVTGVPDTGLRDQIDAYQQARTDAQGRYRLRGIKPGSYTLYAWESMEDWSFMDPDFLRSYESQGVSIKLGSKDRQVVPLRLIVPEQ